MKKIMFKVFIFVLLFISVKSVFSKDLSIIERMYENGNYHDAFIAGLKLAGENDPVALRIVGLIYLDGVAVNKDTNKALIFLQKSGGMNDVVALDTLALLFFSGVQVKKNLASSVSYSQKSYQLGSAVAMCQLGVMHYRGLYFPKNPEKAYRLFKEGGESEECLIYLGDMYLKGGFVEKNILLSLKYYKEAAGKFSWVAMDKVKWMYSGVVSEIPLNKMEMQYWGLRSSIEKIRYAGKLNDNSYENKASLIVGDMALKGNVAAQYALWLISKETESSDQKLFKNALSWLMEAANNDYFPAQLELAWLYHNGIYFRRNLGESASWGRKGFNMLKVFAERGDVASQYNMASLYFHGIGVSVDFKLAKHWVEKAKDGGYPDADELLRKVQKNIGS